MKMIHTSDAPVPVGHYAQAVTHGNLVFVSGQLPIKPHTFEKVTGSIEEQCTQVLENIKTILLAAGSDLSKVLKVSVYITDIHEWGKVNNIYEAFMDEAKPARSIISVKELHYGASIEMDVIACI